MRTTLVWLGLGLVCAFGCVREFQNSDMGHGTPAVQRGPVAVAAAPIDPAPAVTDGGFDAGPQAHESVTSSEGCTPRHAETGMRLVPGGTFIMGTDEGGEEDEHPAHTVTIDPFWLDIYEVTVQEYGQCVAAGVCRAARDEFELPGAKSAGSRFRRPNQPITGISWDDASTYCSFRGRRLPREAEWERAARGDDARRYPWGNTSPNPALHGCFARALGTRNGTTCDVGSYPAGIGPYGHHDMAGNVWEWMADYYDPFAYRRSRALRGEPGDCAEIMETQNWLRSKQRHGFTGTNPIPSSCERVLRGGAFNYPATGLRSSNRVHHPGDWRLLMAGVRCAKDRAEAENSSRVPCAQGS